MMLEGVLLQSKKDLGLIGSDGQDYITILTFSDLQEGIKNGRFGLEPEFAKWDNS